MSAMNIAFNRELIGVAMFLPAMGEAHPLGLNDDMWAGYCAKVRTVWTLHYRHEQKLQYSSMAPASERTKVLSLNLVPYTVEKDKI